MATLSDYYNSSANKSLQQQLIDAKLKGDTNAVNQVSQAGQQLYQGMGSPTSDTVAQPKQDSFSQVQQYINQLKEQQKQAQLASLGKARDSSLSNLATERAQIQPLYYNARSKESTGSQLQGKNFAEYLAQRNQSMSGVSGQAELARNVALQGNLGQLRQGEATAYTDNAKRVSDVNNAYESDVASANANIEAQALQNLMSAYQQQQSADREQANLDRSYNYQVGRDTLSDLFNQQQFDYQKQQNTIDNEYRQTQANIDNLYQQGQLTLAQRSQALNEAQFQAQLKQQAVDNAYRQQQANSDNAYRYAALNKSSGSSGSSSYTKSQIKDATLEQFDQLLSTDHNLTNQWLTSNRQELIQNLGYEGYKSLVDKYSKAVKTQSEQGYEKRLINSGGR